MHTDVLDYMDMVGNHCIIMYIAVHRLFGSATLHYNYDWDFF